MHFEIKAKTEKGKEAIKKILNHKRYRRLQQVIKKSDSPLTIVWIFSIFKKVNAGQVSAAQKLSFENLIIDMFSQEGCTKKDYGVEIK